MSELVYLTPGPTARHPNFQEYINDAIRHDVDQISHRSKNSSEIFKNTKQGLEAVLGLPCGNFHIFFLDSATYAMETVIRNMVAKHSYHFVNGAFADRFFNTATDVKKSPQRIDVPYGQRFDLETAVIPGDTELFALTVNETSTGVALDREHILRLKNQNPSRLVAIDQVTASPYLNANPCSFDAAFFSVQKGFHMPAGLGVLIVSKDAIAKSSQLERDGYDVGSNYSFSSLLKSEQKDQQPQTPNQMWIYILGRVCEHYDKIGMDNIRKQTEEKAQMLYDFFDRHPAYAPFVEDKNARSNTIIVVKTPNGSAEVIDKLKANGIMVGSGYAKFEKSQIRIANFPMHRPETMEQLMKVLGK